MLVKFIYKNYRNLISFIRRLINTIFPKSKYYQKIQFWMENNKKRKYPKRYFVMKLEGEDANKNAIFSSFKLGIKSHMIVRGYLGKVASLLPPCNLQQCILRLAGLKIDKDVFIAPEITIDIVLNGWTRFHKGSSVGIRVNCFNHMFERNGRIILGYIDVGEGALIGGFTTLSPGVTIGKDADIGAEVKIGPGVRIGNNVKVGPCSMIGPLITIGEGAIVATGSVVLESVKPYTKVAGNPAKEISGKIKAKKRKLELILNQDFKTENELPKYEGSVQELQTQEITSSTYHEFISRILDIRKTY